MCIDSYSLNNKLYKHSHYKLLFYGVAAALLCCLTMSVFEHIPGLVPDGVFTMIEAYRVDPNNRKVNLSPGIYRDDNAKTWVLPSVKKVIKFQAPMEKSI